MTLRYRSYPQMDYLDRGGNQNICWYPKDENSMRSYFHTGLEEKKGKSIGGTLWEWEAWLASEAEAIEGIKVMRELREEVPIFLPSDLVCPPTWNQRVKHSDKRVWRVHPLGSQKTEAKVGEWMLWERFTQITREEFLVPDTCKCFKF